MQLWVQIYSTLHNQILGTETNGVDSDRYIAINSVLSEHNKFENRFQIS